MEPVDLIKQYNEEFDVEWACSVAPIKTENGFKPAGTCILLGNHIIFLDPRTKEELERIKTVVVDAIDFELKRRMKVD